MTALENDGPNSIDIVAPSRALGNLEATMEAIKAGQDELRESVRETNRRVEETNRRIDDTNRRIDDTNRRMDRLFYAIIGMGGALVVAVLVSNFLGS